MRNLWLHGLVFGFVFCALFVRPVRACAQTSPPAWSPTANYKPGDLVVDNGNYYRCLSAITNAPNRDPSEYYTSWQLYDVQNNTTLLIGTGQSFPNFEVAWSYVQNAVIAQGVYLHLTLAPNTAGQVESFTSPLNLDHPYGASISINISTFGITFSFPGNGITLDDGHSLAVIDSLAITGSGQNGTGFSASGNASIGDLSCAISGFSTGISSDQGAKIHSVYGCSVGNCHTLVSATRRGNIYFNLLSEFGQAGTPTVTPGVQYGLYATEGGFISLYDCFIDSCSIGAFASDGGIIDAEKSNFSANGVGVQADMKGHIDCESAVFGDPYQEATDIECAHGASVDATGAIHSAVVVGTNDGSYVFGT